MKLAVRKDEGSVPGGGYHYMLHPIALEPGQEHLFNLMGYIIIEVEEDRGNVLLLGAKNALMHQLEVAVLADAAEQLKAQKDD